MMVFFAFGAGNASPRSRRCRRHNWGTGEPSTAFVQTLSFECNWALALVALILFALSARAGPPIEGGIPFPPTVPVLPGCPPVVAPPLLEVGRALREKLKSEHKIDELRIVYEPNRMSRGACGSRMKIQIYGEIGPQDKRADREGKKKAAKKFIKDYEKLLGPSDVDMEFCEEWEGRGYYDSQTNGFRRRCLDGIPIDESGIRVGTRADGTIVTVSGSLVDVPEDRKPEIKAQIAKTHLTKDEAVAAIKVKGKAKLLELGEAHTVSSDPNGVVVVSETLRKMIILQPPYVVWKGTMGYRESLKCDVTMDAATGDVLDTFCVNTLRDFPPTRDTTPEEMQMYEERNRARQMTPGPVQ